jgi:hypothetical protein
VAVLLFQFPVDTVQASHATGVRASRSCLNFSRALQPRVTPRLQNQAQPY